MRHTRTSSLFALLAIVFMLAAPGCETLDKVLNSVDGPQASLAGASLSDLSTQGATLDFEVDVTNPYSVPLPLTSLSYDLSSKGSTFLTGAAPIAGTVPARGTRTITLPANVRFSDLMSALSGVRPGQVVPYDAGLTLSVDAPGVGPLELPLRQRGELPVPAVPEVKLAGIEWSELSLTNAKAVLKFDVRNTNQFRVDLSALDTSLALGGRDIGRTSIREALGLGPGKRGTLEAPISFSPVQFGASILNMLRGANADYRLDGAIEGATPFGPITLPFERAGRAPLSGG